MTKETLIWAVFVSILCPLFLRSPGDPILLTAMQIGACWAAVAWMDRIERAPKADTVSPADPGDYRLL